MRSRLKELQREVIAMNEKTSRDKIITRCFKVPDFKALEKRDAGEGTAPDDGIRRLEGHGNKWQ